MSQKGPGVICRAETVNLWTVNFSESKGFVPFAGWRACEKTASSRQLRVEKFTVPVRDLRSLWEVSSVSSPPLTFTSRFSAPSFVRAVVNSCQVFDTTRPTRPAPCLPASIHGQPHCQVRLGRAHARYPPRNAASSHSPRRRSAIRDPAAPGTTTRDSGQSVNDW